MLALFCWRYVRRQRVLDKPQLLTRQQKETVPQELSVRLGINRLVNNTGNSGELHQGGDGGIGNNRQIHDGIGLFLPDNGYVSRFSRLLWRSAGGRLRQVRADAVVHR